jgi:thioredoxin 1
MAHEVTDATFDQDVLKASLPVLVDFWAPWCGPCKSMTPIMEELATEYTGKAAIMKLNVDENGGTAEKYGVMSIPTFIIFRGGDAVATFVGAKSKEDVKKEIDAAIA